MQPINIKVYDNRLVINIGMECNEKIIGFDDQYYYAIYTSCNRFGKLHDTIRVYLPSKQRLIKHCDLALHFHRYTNIKVRVIGGSTYLHTEHGYYLLDKEFGIFDRVEAVAMHNSEYKYMRNSMITDRYYTVRPQHNSNIVAVDRYQGNHIMITSGITEMEHSNCIVIRDRNDDWIYHFDDGTKVVYHKSLIANGDNVNFTPKGMIVRRSKGQIDFIDMSGNIHILHSDGHPASVFYDHGNYFAIISQGYIEIYCIEALTPCFIYEQYIGDHDFTFRKSTFNILPIAGIIPSKLMFNNRMHSDLDVVCSE